MKKIYSWQHNTFFREKEYELNSQVAKKISEKDNLEELSLAYTHINSENINKFFRYIPNIEEVLTGAGIDLGGGRKLYRNLN